METVSLSDPISEFSIDQELYKSASALKAELGLFNERLLKMEECRSQFSEVAYLKVKTDYMARHEQIKAAFNEKKQAIQKALYALYQHKKEQQRLLQQHREVLEEAKLRKLLGEYSEEKFEQIESAEKDEIKSYEHLLTVLQDNIGLYEEVIGGPLPEVEEPKPLEVVTPAPVKEKPTPQKTADLGEETNPFIENQIAEAQEDLSEEGGLIDEEILDASERETFFSDEEGDYFEKEERESFEGALIEEEVEELSAQEVLDALDAAQQGAVIEGPKQGKLVCIDGNLEVPEFILGESTGIGRSPSNDITLKEAKISRQHATINKINDEYVIVDLKSSNGVYVNDERVEEATLKAGDEVRIGSYRFLYQEIPLETA